MVAAGRDERELGMGMWERSNTVMWERINTAVWERSNTVMWELSFTVEPFPPFLCRRVEESPSRVWALWVARWEYLAQRKTPGALYGAAGHCWVSWLVHLRAA